jgi:probable HAF family extracellular repeat protein
MIRHGITLSSLAIFSALGVSCTPGLAGTIEYTVTPLGELDGGPMSYPTAMNDSGQIAGNAEIYTQYTHAFLYPGSFPLINLGSFAGDNSVSAATSINQSGVVVGYSDTPSGNVNAFKYTAAAGLRNLGTLGGSFSQAESVNNSGQIVGISTTTSGADDGFICSGNGPMIDLGPGYAPLLINDAGLVAAVAGSSASNVGTYISSGGTGAWVSIGSLGGTETQPAGISNRGEIVGFSTTTPSGTDQAAFLFSGGTMTNLGSFGGTESSANGENDEGLVVGYSALPGDSISHAFVYSGSGPIQDLNDLIDPTLGWTLTNAQAINSMGQIAAEGYQVGGEDQAVLLMPVPEPKKAIPRAASGEKVALEDYFELPRWAALVGTDLLGGAVKLVAMPRRDE